MIQEQGTVVEVRPGSARVQTRRSGSCESCKARGGCSSLGGGREARVWVVDPLGVNVADEVVVAVPEGTVVRASLLLYLVPVLALLGGAVLGDQLAPRFGLQPDLGAAVVGIAGMVLAFTVARAVGARETTGPKIIRRA